MQFKYSLLCGVLLASSALAGNDAHLQKQLEAVGATNVKISDSVLPGFKTAVSDQGMAQISEDGRYLIQGKVFELKDGKAVDITYQALMEQLKALEPEMIVFPAKDSKYTVTVFMDTSCHYCHILHSKIKEYNDLGITVRYLAFPRGGLNSQTAKQMETIWTAKDRVFALNEADKGELPKQLKTPEIVKKHYQLGLKLGITGTPSIVTTQGEVLPGYIPPEELHAILAQ